MSNKKLVKEIKKAIIKDFGKKCPDYNSDCATCIAWQTYEKLKELLELSEETN